MFSARGLFGLGGASGFIAPDAQSTWAARGSGSTVGQRKYISDIIATRLIEVQWNGTYWIACADLQLTNLTAVTGVQGTDEQILLQIPLAAGLLLLGTMVTIGVVPSRNSTTDTATTRFRLGTAGTVADQELMSVSLASTNRATAPKHFRRIDTATSLIIAGASAGTIDYSPAGSTVTYPQAVTVSNIDTNALILTASMQMAGSTSIPTLAELILSIIQ